ncbi:MAG TPA: PIG-L deacetylase family protein [Actinomycetota bacterium]
MTRRLAAVFAHPDDDTYGVGGTVGLHADAGIEVTAILATSGDAGRIFDRSLATRQNLGMVREGEDRAAWGELGVKPALHFLRHPDGGLQGVPGDELVSRIAELLAAARPEVVVTFGPEGVTGHEDHIAIGEAATAGFHWARKRSSEGSLARLLYVAIPQSSLDRLNALLRERGIEPPDPTQPFVPRGVPDETIAVMVDCSPVYQRKLEALRQHKTQGELEDVPYELWPEALGREAFVMAWPERAPGDPVLSDVFEGLPGA